MIETASIIIGGYIVPWTLTIMILAILSWFFLSYAIYTAGGGKRIALWIFFLPAAFFSAVFARMIYWYCHSEQYDGIISALTDMSVDGFAMLGVLPGVMLAAAIVTALKLADSFAGLLDALAPGGGIGMGILYLTALFNAGCRGKIVVNNPEYQHLPFSSPITTAGGAVEYRFATFFFSFLVMVFIGSICMEYYFNMKEEKGATSILFLILFCSSEFVLDSTRYDAGFFRFNGFVSVLQIFAGVVMLSMLAGFGICMVKRHGFKWYYLPLWIFMLSSMGVTGYLEYLVQRHGDRFVVIYSLMIVSSMCMGVAAYVCYRLSRPDTDMVNEVKAVIREVKEAASKEPEEDIFGLEEDELEADEMRTAKRKKHGTLLSIVLAAAAAVMAVFGFVTLLLSRKNRRK